MRKKSFRIKTYDKGEKRFLKVQKTRSFKNYNKTVERQNNKKQGGKNVTGRARNHHYWGAGSGIVHEGGKEIVPEFFVRGDHGVLFPAESGGNGEGLCRVIFFFLCGKPIRAVLLRQGKKLSWETIKAPISNDNFLLYP